MVGAGGWGLRHHNNEAWKIYKDGILETSERI